MSQFGTINPLFASFPTLGSTALVPPEAEGEENFFVSIFESAVDNVRETDKEKNEMEYALATGQLDNPAELTIASTKAQLSVDFLVQLRSKALDAYSELTRISL